MTTKEQAKYAVDHMPRALLVLAILDAERVMEEIDKAVRRGYIDARSPIGDARLDYCEPGKSRLDPDTPWG